MSENWQIAIFTVIGGWLGLLTVGWLNSMNSIRERVAIMETTIKLMGEHAFKALHSPDDHLGFDELVDKYEQNNDDLPREDWERVESKATELLNDREKYSPPERAMLGLVVAFARHKLMRYGRTKPKA